jgi:hypothetical protein
MFSTLLMLLSTSAFPGVWFWPWAMDFGGIYPSWLLGFSIATRVIDVVGIIVIITLLIRKKKKQDGKVVEERE